MAELVDYLPAALVSRTFVQYLTAFCSRLEAASDVISVVTVDLVGMDLEILRYTSRSLCDGRTTTKDG